MINFDKEMDEAATKIQKHYKKKKQNQVKQSKAKEPG